MYEIKNIGVTRNNTNRLDVADRLSAQDKQFLGTWILSNASRNASNNENDAASIINIVDVQGSSCIGVDKKVYDKSMFGTMYYRRDKITSNPFTHDVNGNRINANILPPDEQNKIKKVAVEQPNEMEVEEQVQTKSSFLSGVSKVATTKITAELSEDEEFIQSTISISKKKGKFNETTEIMVPVIVDFDIDKIVKTGKSMGIPSDVIANIISNNLVINQDSVNNAILNTFTKLVASFEE